MKNNIRYSYGDKTYIIVSKNGTIIDADGLGLICWFNIYEDINKKFVGKHISELRDYLVKNTAVPESVKGFNKITKKYQRRKLRILSFINN